MGKKHKKGKKRSSAPKAQPVQKKPSFKWLYIIIAAIAVIWLFSQFASGSDYPDISTPKTDKGAEGASVLIEEFSDLECPACRRFHPIIQLAMDEFEGDVKWRYYHFPLTNIHPFAQTAAIGAECANNQGLFWEYVDIVYENQENIRKSDLINYASSIGADETFEDCINSNTKNDEIAMDVAEGNKRNVRGTPSVYVNGKPITSLSYDSLKAAIERELSQ